MKRTTLLLPPTCLVSLPTNQPGRKAKTGRRTVFLKTVALCMLMLSGFAGKAQFPVNQTFTGAPGSATNFTLGGNAALTGTNTTPGYLQLTQATTNQAGYAIYNNSFASPQGFSISFEFFSYGGTTPGADGFSVFLIDAAGTDPKVNGQFNIGASGGSLGYAQKTLAAGATDIPGVSKGYLGIGIDEFGNYPNPTEGRIGGPGQVAQNVTLRGPGTGLTGYQFLTSSGALPFSVDVATVRAQSGSADYRKAFIYVVAANGAYNVTVRIQHGNTILTTTDSYPISTPPANLRIGFAGSTGASTNIHEIRNLAIVSNPVAVNDLAGTNYNTPVTFSVVGNDKAFGTTLANNTVDLDPTTPNTRETSFTVTGQGTFTVDANGVVTFTPVNGFAGTVTIPYTVNDLLGQMSNPGKITVVVKGADVATNVSGPASASPGSQITYTVNTTNIGPLTATNIRPTLQLPGGLTVATSPNYTYNSTSGLVTFSQTTLAQNVSVSNSVTLTVPASGTTSITATSGYVYPAGAVVADPVASNNSGTLTTTVTGLTNIAMACATPGKDGPGSLGTTSVPNTYYPGVSVSTANGISTITVGTASGANPLVSVAAGDLVLVMQMQGATINTSATDVNYGTVISSTAGQYEYAKVASVSGSTITLTTALGNGYTTSAGQNFQVVRVPQYSSLAVNGLVTGTAWDSQKKVGGVLALDVAGATTFVTGTAPGLSMTAKGFSGGGGKSYVGAASNTPAVYASLALSAHGSKGEGIAGTPRYLYNGGTAVIDNGITNEGYATGSNNIGAPANGGGGAQDYKPLDNSGNAGGGGGGNATNGGVGGYGFGSNSTGAKAIGGRGIFDSSTKIIIMGGGGGAGSSNDASLAINSSGGVGGGIIILRTGTVAGPATIQANGGDAPTTAASKIQGGGGGGAGGTAMVFVTPTAPIGQATSGLANITMSVIGGKGGTVNIAKKGSSYGPGGGGSGGVVYATGPLAATSVIAGANGLTSDGTNFGTTAFGAAVGADGTTDTATDPTATNTIGGANSCLPMLSVALSTATPNVTRANGTPRPASYTATVSNTGGPAQVTSTTLTLDPLFTYVTAQTPTVTLTAADGTVTTLSAANYTLTGAGTSTPVFSDITIPSGSTLSIGFSAAIVATAVNGTVYQASGGVTFTDPTRTTATGTTTPGNTFASGGGTVPGTNYAAASSPLENVTIVAPLPVELTRFEVAAQRQDAVLTWTTASEKNNDHFVVERSVNGRYFTGIGNVRGQGNSTRPTDYRFTDAGAGRLASGKLYYRLQQVDADGTPAYSQVRAVEFAAPAKAMAALYPNPSQDEATIDLSGLADGIYTVTVLDLTGRVLRTQQLGALASPLGLKGLSVGAYIVLVKGVGISQALPLIRN